MKHLWSAALAAALVLAGCGESEQEAPTSAPDQPGPTAPAEGRAEANPFVAAVDSDAAYVYANLQRLPGNVIDRLWEINDTGAEGSTKIFDELAEDEELTPELRALLEELSRISTRDGWEAAGLHSNPFYAFHGASMMPMLHLELADGDAFAAFIGRIEANLTEPLVRRDVKDVQVLWLGVGKGFGLALRHDADSVTAALIPDDATMLARVAGHYEPAEPMQTGTLDDFLSEAGFASRSGGYIDWRLVVDQILAEDSAIARLDRQQETEALRDEPACVAEFQALAKVLPRLVAGYTRIDADAAAFRIRQELSQDLAGRLVPVARAPVSVDRELEGLFNFGLAIDLVAGREFARSLVDGWVESPPRCPAFQEIANNAASWQESLNRPMPPVISNLQGMFLEADSLKIGEGGLPTGGGTLSFYMRNPQLLVGMAQMFSPAVAELALEPGGEPIKVPPGAISQLEQANLEAWLAMGENAIGVAIGAEHVDALKNSIRPAQADDLLLGAKVDMAIVETFVDFVDMAEQAMSEIDGVDAEEILAAQRAQYKALAEAYEKVEFEMRLSESGVEIATETTFR